MAAPFRVLSWNVNSIRTRLDHVLTYLADHEPDVVCLQETKTDDALFPRIPFMELGYKMTVYGSKGYAGVATLTKVEPSSVHRGFREGVQDKDCRILNVVVAGIRVYNLYVPNGGEVGSDTFDHKLDWLARLRTELDAHERPDASLVMVGDFNVAPDDRDVYDPEGFRGHLHFTDEEHAALANLLGFGLHDCFRKHVDDAGHYTWYDYRNNGFARGLGMRIDHVYATPPMLDRCRSVVHDSGPRGWETPSDHLPVLATFE